MTGHKKPRPVREAVSLYEAKTHLSELVELAAQGREIIIAKSGKPKARLMPLAPKDTRHLRKPGLLRCCGCSPGNPGEAAARHQRAGPVAPR